MAKLLINNDKKVLVGSNGKAYAVENMDALVSDTYPVNITASDGRIMKLLRIGKLVQSETPTPDAPADIVCNNGVLKARHQSGLPLGYTLLDYIESTGTQWIDTGVKMNASHIIYSDGFERSGNFGQLVHGYVDNNNRLGATIYGGTSKNVAYYWVLGGIGKKRYQDSNIITNNINVNARFQMTQGSSGITFTQGNNTYQVENYGGITSGIGAKNWYIFKTEATGQGMTMGVLYNAKIMQGTAILHNYVPCYRKSDNVIGVYDLISGQFFTNQGTGDFIAGDPVSDPVEIYADGMVETINVHGKNLFDKNNLPERIYAYFSSTGTTWNYAAQGYSLRFPCLPNTTYTIRYNGNSTQEVLSFASTNNDDVPSANQINVTVTQAIRQQSPTINTPITLTTGANDKWLIVQYNVADPQNTDMRDNLQIELGSTATAYQPYTAPQTASITDILAVDEYKDEQDIISGTVVRRVGVKVFDGTEDWVAYTSSTLVIQDATSAWGAVAGVGGYCTHLTVLKAGKTTFAGACRFAKAFNLYEYKTAFGVADVAGFKAKLAELYAAGTPVIVVYPLADTTKEQVTPQPLTTNEGQNIINDVACIDNPELYIIYKI